MPGLDASGSRCPTRRSTSEPSSTGRPSASIGRAAEHGVAGRRLLVGHVRDDRDVGVEGVALGVGRDRVHPRDALVALDDLLELVHALRLVHLEEVVQVAEVAGVGVADRPGGRRRPREQRQPEDLGQDRAVVARVERAGRAARASPSAFFTVHGHVLGGHLARPGRRRCRSSATPGTSFSSNGVKR